MSEHRRTAPTPGLALLGADLLREALDGATGEQSASPPFPPAPVRTSRGPGPSAFDQPFT
ncbi:hypothetical protein [Streptomyces sp. NPDC057910]|uniref:hypothetical protein n=1 Tax=Streptomyces sp. NPDC057910 TaxID=3346278 RepID=UPI0036E7E155